MRRQVISFEQAISGLLIAALLGLLVYLYLSYPKYPALGDRREMLPREADEVYKIALNASGKSYPNLYPRTGRNPFIPGTELYIVKSRTPTPSRTITPITLRTTTKTSFATTVISIKPTEPPYELPVTLSGFYKADETSERMVILRIKATGELITLSVGMEIAGIKVVEITPISVKLLAPNGNTYELRDPRSIELE
jgi:hypothetical protein